MKGVLNMAFEPTYEKVVSGFRKNLGTTQAVIECRLPLGDTKVGSILCVNADSFVVGSEVVDGVVTFNGFVAFKAVYKDEEMEPMGVDYTAEFRDKYSLQTDAVVLAPIVTSTVVDIQSSILDHDIKVVAILEISIDGVVGNEVQVLTALNDGNSFTKNEVLNYSAFLGVATDKCDVVLDVEILDSVFRILSVCATAHVEKVTANDKFVTVAGGVNYDICYLADNGRIRTQNAHTEFATEVVNDNINASSNLQSLVNIVLNDIKVSTAVDVDKAIVTIDLPVRYSGYIFNTCALDVISDVFNANYYLNVDYENISIQNSHPAIEMVERISGNAQLDDKMPFMDEVLGVCCSRVVLANTGIEEGRLLLEGVAYTTVIYLNKEEDRTISTQVEMPFSILSTLSDTAENFTPIVHVSMGDTLAKGKRGKEIDITAKLHVYVDFYNIASDVVITNVAASGEKVADDLVLCLYIAKDGDTVWDIAKEMNVSPELILEQNQELEFPLAAGVKVIVYKQRLIEY